MEQLIERLKVLHATNFAFYLKLHFFHWNVEGPMFKQYHDFFGGLYEDAFGAVDTYAESLRALQAYAPGSFSRLSEISEIADQINPITAKAMLQTALLDNAKIMPLIKEVRDLADEQGEIGLTNFLEARFEIHRKHQWMLRASLKD